MANTIIIERCKLVSVCKAKKTSSFTAVLMDDWKCTFIDLEEDEVKLSPDEYLKVLFDKLDDDDCLTDDAIEILTDARFGLYPVTVDDKYYPPKEEA